jgi:hypothetical protein
VGLRIEPMASHMLGKCSTIELHPQATTDVLSHLSRMWWIWLFLNTGGWTRWPLMVISSCDTGA